ncbi:AzlD domain-containing protein [Paenibacillus dendritiformis]|jgi:branched-subunit amino acid transport protein|uniref:Branched-chain amino acid transport n=1 Tax=Paenibacillus dendritiformis C454 TaxID=1131935 RepID=H3SCV3_9BACL|nr:AzlD domain-containing protein [Paenibacillus dendritiformis]EHQ63027.1 branched-chain amino acid transport [Paenibacillus dendritiformis C454]PZM63821.1 AzlD domain-containing protein [Paenibacillus dendritiformis]TDL48214.1 AzlD domain-containing protein [Paenibacillus dendritiformis]WGU95895.1 AzlD domain-containing protein [Paenibacillus dendritiformis]CAH8771021.1 AzlD domain-containing protein [Paenibacillus dendritiformis]
MISLPILIVICVAAAATYLTRYPSMALARYIKMSPGIERGFRYVPIGVFAALVAPAIFYHPTVDGQIEWMYYVAVVVTSLTAWLSKSPLWAMVAGVLVIALLRLI